MCWGVNGRRTRNRRTDLEGERRNALPHAKGPTDRPLGVFLTHFRGEVGNAAKNRIKDETIAGQ